MEVNFIWRIDCIGDGGHHMCVGYERIPVSHDLHDNFWPVFFVILFASIVDHLLILAIKHFLGSLLELALSVEQLGKVWRLGVIFKAERDDLPHILVMPSIESTCYPWCWIESWQEIIACIKSFHLIAVMTDDRLIFARCELADSRRPYE